MADPLHTVAEVISTQIATIGENIRLSRVASMQAGEGMQLGSYLHMGGKIGVLIEIGAAADEETVKDVAMHVAAAEPRFVSRDDVPQSVIDEEREIARAQAQASGKPAQVIEKIADGKVAKYFEQACLLEQPFVKNPEQTVQAMLAARGGATVKTVPPLQARRGSGCGGRVSAEPRYRRIVLKLSGEVLMGTQPFGIAAEILPGLAAEIADVHDLGVEVAIVIGGGNIIRGIAATEQGLDRVTGDHMGMLATVINALALQDALERRSCFTRVQTAIDIREVAEPYIRRRAMRHLEKRRVVIFAAGTGNPFFTTDSAAALRASEIRADVLLKGTKVDGLYTADPVKNADATLLKRVDYRYLLEHGLKVMDAAAVSLCQNAHIPIRIFNIRRARQHQAGGSRRGRGVDGDGLARGQAERVAVRTAPGRSGRASRRPRRALELPGSRPCRPPRCGPDPGVRRCARWSRTSGTGWTRRSRCFATSSRRCVPAGRRWGSSIR